MCLVIILCNVIKNITTLNVYYQSRDQTSKTLKHFAILKIPSSEHAQMVGNTSILTTCLTGTVTAISFIGQTHPKVPRST